jgi:hypothetical protein
MLDMRREAGRHLFIKTSFNSQVQVLTNEKKAGSVYVPQKYETPGYCFPVEDKPPV